MENILISKICSWSEARENIRNIISDKAKDPGALTIPYGLQLQDKNWCPQALRFVIQFKGNTGQNQFVFHHGVGLKHRIETWDMKKNRNTDDAERKLKNTNTDLRIFHFAYVPKHWAFVGYCSDLSLRVFSANFEKISTAFVAKTVMCMLYNDVRDDIITGVQGGVRTWKFPIGYSDPLVPGYDVQNSFTAEDWVRSFKVDALTNQILAIAERKIAMLDIASYQEKCVFSKDLNVSFTTCTFYHPLCFFITGTKDGAIKAWSTTIKGFPFVYKFTGHCDAITSLVVHPTEPLLLSSSRDKTVRIWNFDTFAQTFRLQTDEQILNMEMISSTRMFYTSEHFIKIWNLNQFHSLFTVLSSKIVKCYRIESPEYPTRLLILAADSSIRLVSPVHGYEITMVMPPKTLSADFIDVTHDIRANKIYIVLGTRSILVYDCYTHPCRADQLWRPECPDEGVCSLAIINAEFAIDENEFPLASSLLFAGHYNGQISLIEGKDVVMKEPLQAHQGQITFLRGSYCQPDVSDSIESRDHLVSCGTDCVVKIWQIHHRKQGSIELAIKSLVKLLRLPLDISMADTTLCLAMTDNSVVMCRVKELNGGSLQASEGTFECLTHHKDEEHTAAINGLSCCRRLKLFATSSYDQSVKIWNFDNQLVRELCFDETLCGVCFANSRGDLLVGFQLHISLVTMTNYLPLPYLEVLSTMHFANDLIEEPRQFNDYLNFWYDPNRVPTMPLDLAKRRKAIQREEKSPTSESLTPSEESSTESITESPQFNRLRRFTRFMSTAGAHGDVLSKFRKSIDVSHGSLGTFGRTSLTSPAEISQESEDELVVLKQSSSEVELDQDAFRPPRYWPCAPDGFIPNSVVRALYRLKPAPEHLQPVIQWFFDPDKYKKFESEEKTPINIDDEYEGLNLPEFPEDLTPSPQEQEVVEEEIETAEELKRRIRRYSRKGPTISLRRRSSLIPIVRAVAEPAVEELWEEEEDEMVEEDERVGQWGWSYEDEEAEEEEAGMEEEEEEERWSQESQASEEEVPEPIKPPPVAVMKTTKKRSVQLEGPELLIRIAQKDWYPNKNISGYLDTASVLNDAITALTSEDIDDSTYRDICREIRNVHGELGLPEDQRNVIERTLIKQSYSGNTNTRLTAIRTLGEMKTDKDEAMLALVRRLVDTNEEIREESKRLLRSLKGVHDLEDLSGLLMKLGVTNPTLRCSDNMVLSELASRLRKLKGRGQTATVKWNKLEKLGSESTTPSSRAATTSLSPKCPRPPSVPAPRSVFKRKTTVMIVHRLKAISNFKSYKSPNSVHDESIVVGDLERFRGDLRRSSLGCKLLQQLDPVGAQNGGIRRQSIELDDMQKLGRWRERRAAADAVQIRGFSLMCQATQRLLHTQGRRLSFLSPISSMMSTTSSTNMVIPRMLSKMRLRANEAASRVRLTEDKKRTKKKRAEEIETGKQTEEQMEGKDEEEEEEDEEEEEIPSLPSVSIVSTATSNTSTELPFTFDDKYLRKLTLNDLLRVLKLDLGKSTQLGVKLLRLLQTPTDDEESLSPVEVNQFSDLLRVIALSPRYLFAASLGQDEYLSEKVQKLVKYLGIYQKIETLTSSLRRENALPLASTKDLQDGKQGGWTEEEKLDNKSGQYLLHTPIRRSLVPGIEGERLAYNLTIKRSVPSPGDKSTDRVNYVVEALPSKLTVDTGRRQWGYSKYGIMQVKWTKGTPSYARGELLQPQGTQVHFSIQNKKLKNNKKSPRTQKLKNRGQLEANENNYTLPTLVNKRLKSLREHGVSPRELPNFLTSLSSTKLPPLPSLEDKTAKPKIMPQLNKRPAWVPPPPNTALERYGPSLTPVMENKHSTHISVDNSISSCRLPALKRESLSDKTQRSIISELSRLQFLSFSQLNDTDDNI